MCKTQDNSLEQFNLQKKNQKINSSKLKEKKNEICRNLSTRRFECQPLVRANPRGSNARIDEEPTLEMSALAEALYGGLIAFST